MENFFKFTSRSSFQFTNNFHFNYVLDWLSEKNMRQICRNITKRQCRKWMMHFCHDALVLGKTLEYFASCTCNKFCLFDDFNTSRNSNFLFQLRGQFSLFLTVIIGTLGQKKPNSTLTTNIHLFLVGQVMSLSCKNQKMIETLIHANRAIVQKWTELLSRMIFVFRF